MKRAAYTYGVDRSGKNYWRSLGELAESKDFKEALEREFPEGAAELKEGVSRRSFLGMMGASLGLAGLAACRRPVEKILPYSRAPEHVIPGRPQYYASALPLYGSMLGVLVESHEGRPTKIEGNPEHPESLGATNALIQAALLDLYDPDRSATPRERGQTRTWEEASAWLISRGNAFRAKRGAGLAILTEAHRSPTLAAQLEQLRKELPEAMVVRYAPFDRDAPREGARLAFGRPLEPILHLDRAQVVLSLDSDFLATERSPVRQAREFADRRRIPAPGEPMNRLYQVESRMSLTGAKADHRLAVPYRETLALLGAIARELHRAHGVDLGLSLEGRDRSAATESSEGRRFIASVARDLAAHRGTGLVIAGEFQPPEVHGLVHLLNLALGNDGRTVSWVRPFDEAPEGHAALRPLLERIGEGRIELLVTLGGNPAFDAPAEWETLQRVPHTVHLSSHFDETGEHAEWHLNRAHPLESWGDGVALDGTASIVQPLIAPLLDGKTDVEVVSLLRGLPRSGYELVRERWPREVWARALHDGIVAGSAYERESVAPSPKALVQRLAALPESGSGLEVTFRPDAHAYDGRMANNGWMQELPEPLTKVTWDNAALVAPSTAVRLGLTDGRMVALTLEGRTVEAPIVIAPGQAPDSIALDLGQGRRKVGKVGEGVGFDLYPLRGTLAGFAASGLTLTPLGRTHELARTQEHSAMEGRPLVREATLTEYAHDPDFAEKMVEHRPLKSVFADHPYNGHKWGMSIDLTSCIGCNACTVACQAENNIPIVGKEGVLRSREMHWIRIDRYFEGASLENPKAVFQPITCQHCEDAPCEQVCPVGATTHSPEGLNDMAYNRCVGTRYCANNCPYKVRRFNFFNYNKGLTELQKMRQNPDVSVRARGVMEKCTFCVQRIEQAKIAAHKAGHDRVKDGAVVTACQQVCPTRAITFGDLNDPSSAVAKSSQQRRGYKLLAELNVRPRNTFLARITNPNPELEQA